MAVIAVAGALFCGMEDGLSLLQGHLDSVGLNLHGGRASQLDFDLGPLTLALNSLLLDEALLCLNLAASVPVPAILPLLLSLLGETCP